jgi:uncharacterized membrane protein YbhN (UPF0104 family)
VAPVLAWCLAAIGHPARFTAVLLALGLPTLIGRVTPSPAGAGPFDAGVVGLLGRYAGIGISEAAAALAIFRVATVLLHALLGVIVFLTLWRPQRVNAADAPAVAVSDQLA